MLGKYFDKTARVKCPTGEPCNEDCNHDKLISNVFDDSKRNSISPSVSKRRKQKQSKHVNIRNSLTRWHSRSRRKSLVIKEAEERPKLITIQNIRESHEPQREGNALCNWCAKKKALLQLRRARNRELDQLKSWEKWRKKEQALIEKARLEKAREDREVEFARQLHEIEQAKNQLARDTLKTKYPYKVDHKKSPPQDYEYDDTSDQKYSDQCHLNDVSENIYKSTSSKAYSKQKLKKGKKKSEIEYPQDYEYYDTSDQMYNDLYQLNDVPSSKAYSKQKSKKGKKKSDFDRQKYTEKIVVQKPLRPPLSHRFVNCFYKFCCEFYCWLTFFLLIGLTLVMLL